MKQHSKHYTNFSCSFQPPAPVSFNYIEVKAGNENVTSFFYINIKQLFVASPSSTRYAYSIIGPKSRRLDFEISGVRIVHGEIPQGFSPRKLTVRPWKASNFPALLTVTTVTETNYLETESSRKGSLNGTFEMMFNKA